MSAITALTLNNGETTPVAKTFDVQFKDGFTAKYAERSNGIVAGFPTIDTTLRPAKGSQARKVVINVAIPTLKEAAASQSSGFVPAPEVQFYDSAHLAFLVHSNTPEAVINDLIAFVQNALDQTTIKEMVKDGMMPH